MLNPVWLVFVLGFVLTAQMPDLSRSHRPVSRVVPDPAPYVQAVKADLTIEGLLAQVVLNLEVKNPATSVGEFDLIFPLGPDAVIASLDLQMDGKTLEGRVLKADEARALYRQITQRDRDPALLEHYGEALYRARVSPIPAGGVQNLRLSYARSLDQEGDLVRIHFPLTAFRRGAVLNTLEINGKIQGNQAPSTIYSPSHPIVVDLGGANRPASFRLSVQGQKPETDFVVYVKPNRPAALIDGAVLSERLDPSAPGYFLATIQGFLAEADRPEPKDVVFVLDRSGSMQGKKIEQAREALRFMLERLRSEDRFGVITYSSTVEQWNAALSNATPDAIAGAVNFGKAIEAGGSTHIEAALTAACTMLQESKRFAQIVFLTDGLPTAGEQNPAKLCDLVRTRNAAKARLVAFGVGFDVNGGLLDRLAVQNRGLSEYVLPSDNIEDKVPGFYARMQSPVLTDATFSVEGTKTLDVYPKELGDLYAGNPVILCGRYLDAGPAKLVVQGKRQGVFTKIEIPVDLAKGRRAGSNDYVARIWAAKKVGFLVDEVRLHGQNPELINEIVAIGKQFGILTEYTAFLAADPVDYGDTAGLSARAVQEFEERAKVESGTHGVAQAANSKKMQRDAVAQGENCWIDSQGRETRVATCTNVAGRTFFQRGGQWQEADSVPATAEDVVLFTPRCFELLDAHPELNRCLARTGNLTIRLGSHWFRFLPPAAD